MINANGPRTGRPSVTASRGMVSSPHYLASATGQNILRQGGSAVDAAIGMSATLCVVYPHMAGLGGDGFTLIAGGKADGVEAIDAHGPAVELATREFYKQNGYSKKIPSRGPLSALTIPGAVDGWRLAHERYGKLPWKDLFADAIYYARHGMPISRSLADWLVTDEAILNSDPDTATTYLPTGEPQREGTILCQNRLARSLEQLATHGARKGFYEGKLAKQIANALTMKGSPLRESDLNNYQARWVKPISSSYRGYDIYQLPPPTQGFSALQIMNILENHDVQSWGGNSVDYYHHLVEAIKVAFADRDEWLGDPRYIDIPMAEFLSKDYAQERNKLINSAAAIPVDEVMPGIEHEDHADRQAPDGDTVYFCAADSDGLVVSQIQSLYHDFGSATTAGDTGIIMQNRGSFFSLDPSHPNALKPGKQSFHTIIPAMLMDGDTPAMAFGTMGGEGQPQTQAALLTRIIDLQYNVQQAIEAPRWLMGRTWGTESKDLHLESRIPDEVIRELRLRGHPVNITEAWFGGLGHAQAIRFHKSQGLYEGGADPRGDGIALGY